MFGFLLVKSDTASPNPVYTDKHTGMMTSSNGHIFRVTGHLCGEFTTQKPVTRRVDAFFDLRLNEWLSKQSWG